MLGRPRAQYDLRQIRAIKRERPDSTHDYRFRVIMAEATVRLDPGDAKAFKMWQDGLVLAI